MRASILCETGEARDVHQMGCLIGYGASAIIPYLGYETCREILEENAGGQPARVCPGAAELSLGARGGGIEDDVEDGHLGPGELSRSADV